MADAKIRIRLDQADFARGLAAMRSDLARTAEAAGDIAINTQRAGGFASLSLGQLAALGGLGLGTFAVGRGLAGGTAAIGRGATEGLSAMLETAVLGDVGAGAKGSLAALDRVKSVAALAVGLGADPNQFQGAFRAFQHIEQARARGQKEIQETLGKDVAFDILDALGRRIVELLEKLVNKVTGGIL